MAARDPHRFVNDLEETALERLIARLESRAKDAVFTRLTDKYASHLELESKGKVLEVGCGTGATLRRLARRGDFGGQGFGLDHSPTFVAAANRFTEEEGLSDRLVFKVGDAHSLEFPEATFDVVIAHTLISHVTDPEQVIREMARVVRPGGTVVVFDGDYASLTYGFVDHEFGRQMDKALVDAAFNNPLIMRDLPRLFPGLGLSLQSAWGDAVAEIGNGSYFKTFAETYVPYVVKAGLLPEALVNAWFEEQRRSIENKTFFAVCNYYTYLAARP